MCLKCWGMLNVRSVYVCVQLNCEQRGQFVSWAVHVLPDRPPPCSSRCWIKILARHCWHCMHTRNGLINSAHVKGKKGVKKEGKGLWTHWQSTLTPPARNHPACSLPAVNSGAASYYDYIYSTISKVTHFKALIHKKTEAFTHPVIAIIWIKCILHFNVTVITNKIKHILHMEV